LPHRNISTSVSFERDLLDYAQSVAAKESCGAGPVRERQRGGVRGPWWRCGRRGTTSPVAQFSVKLAAESLKAGLPRREVKALLEEAEQKFERLKVEAPSSPEVHTPAARTSASAAREGAPGAGRRGA
jgi:hypothetical protein